MTRYWVLILVLVMGSAPFLAVGQDRTVSAEEAVRLALQNSHQVMAARSDAQATEAAAGQARTTRWPTISASGGYTRLSDNIPSLDVELPPGFEGFDGFTLAPVVLDRYQAMLSVDAPLFTGFRIGNTIKAAEHEAAASGYDLRGAEVDLAYEVRATYWGFVQAVAARDVVLRASEQVATHLQDVLNRVQFGAATNSEALTIRTRLSDIRVDSVQAENAVRVARMELNRLTGLPLEADTMPVDSDLSQMSDGGMGLGPAEGRAARGEGNLDSGARDSGDGEGAYTDHPALNALEERSSALEARVGAARADWFPDISAFGRYIYARPNQYFFLDQDEFKGTWEVGLAARWTIWDWNRRGKAVEEAQARLSGVQSRREELSEVLDVEVARRRLEVEGALESLEAAALNVEEAQEGFRLMRGEYELGAALTAQVLDAETSLRRAHLRQIQARADLAIAQAGLLRAFGRIE